LAGVRGLRRARSCLPEGRRRISGGVDAVRVVAAVGTGAVALGMGIRAWHGPGRGLAPGTARAAVARVAGPGAVPLALVAVAAGRCLRPPAPGVRGELHGAGGCRMVARPAPCR